MANRSDVGLIESSDITVEGTAMQLLLVQAASNGSNPLLSMPTELIISIFGLLPSFSDVFALAETCHRLQTIWTENVASIYSQVAPRSIPCERHARSFLADQVGPPLESSKLSSRDVVYMVRNSGIVQESILQFEKQIVWKVKCGPYPGEKFYGVRSPRHPPQMTRTERRRFIRSYYRLWGMMRLDSAKWQSRLESMTLKQLYQVFEISNLSQNIGREEVPTSSLSGRSIWYHGSSTRLALKKRIWEQIKYIYQRVHNEEAESAYTYAKYEGHVDFVVMWDHWQECFKVLVCNRPPTRPSRMPSLEKLYLWDDSSDEEV